MNKCNWKAGNGNTVKKVERTRKAVRTAKLERVNAKTALDLVRSVFIVN